MTAPYGCHQLGAINGRVRRTQLKVIKAAVTLLGLMAYIRYNATRRLHMHTRAWLAFEEKQMSEKKTKVIGRRCVRMRRSIVRTHSDAQKVHALSHTPAYRHLTILFTYDFHCQCRKACT